MITISNIKQLTKWYVYINGEYTSCICKLLINDSETIARISYESYGAYNKLHKKSALNAYIVNFEVVSEFKRSHSFLRDITFQEKKFLIEYLKNLSKTHNCQIKYTSNGHKLFEFTIK